MTDCPRNPFCPFRAACLGPNGDAPEIPCDPLSVSTHNGLRSVALIGEITASMADMAVRELESAAADSAVRGLLLIISSGGGKRVAGERIVSAIQTARADGLHVGCWVRDHGVSAAFHIGCYCDPFYATSRARLGGFGTTSLCCDREGRLAYFATAPKKAGVPDGPPTVLSIKFSAEWLAEQRADMVEEHDAAVRALAAARGLGVDTFVHWLGDGRTVASEEALRGRLIDGIGDADDARVAMLLRINGTTARDPNGDEAGPVSPSESDQPGGGARA